LAARPIGFQVAPSAYSPRIVSPSEITRILTVLGKPAGSVAVKSSLASRPTWFSVKMCSKRVLPEPLLMKTNLLNVTPLLRTTIPDC
jgi:hypothetical protein